MAVHCSRRLTVASRPSTWESLPPINRKPPTFEPPVPMLFVYGRRKPFHFHTPGWADALAARPGNAVRAFETGHWVMARRSQEFNEVVEAWLAA